MPSKQVTISSRITHEDAEFISQLEISGAKTPSDKFRAIIADARRRSLRKQDYAGSLQMIQEIILPVMQTIRKTEVENQIHSEIITRLAEWMPDTIAFLVSSISGQGKQEIKQNMLQLERGLSERLFRLMESILQLAITGRCPCYDKDTINRQIDPVLDLCQIIMSKR